MMTTVEVPDDLYRRVKSEAALRGLQFRDLVEEGLRLTLDAHHGADCKPTLAELTESARGMIESVGSPARPAHADRTIDAETDRAARAFLKRLEGKYPPFRSASVRQPRAGNASERQRRRHRRYSWR